MNGKILHYTTFFSCYKQKYTNNNYSNNTKDIFLNHSLACFIIYRDRGKFTKSVCTIIEKSPRRYLDSWGQNRFSLLLFSFGPKLRKCEFKKH